MLDPKKIQLMTQIAIYEKNEAPSDLKIGTYFKKDYSSMNVLITIIWVTIGYVLVAGLFVLCNIEAIFEDLTMTGLVTMVGLAVGIYLVLIIVYGIWAGSYYKTRYTKANQQIKKYYRNLSRLQKMGQAKENHKS